MATVPAPLPEKSSPRENVPTKPESGETRTPGAVEGSPVPAKSSPWIWVLGGLSAGLCLAVGWLATTVSARNKTILQSQNRTEQREAATTILQSELTVAKGDTAKAKIGETEATAESVQLRTQVDDSKAGAVELQTQLDKTRVTANTFQSQMEDAKVASIRRQGEVELAKTQTTVLQAQWAQAKADTERLQLRLDEVNLRLEATQEKLRKSESDVALLRKSPARN